MAHHESKEHPQNPLRTALLDALEGAAVSEQPMNGQGILASMDPQLLGMLYPSMDRQTIHAIARRINEPDYHPPKNTFFSKLLDKILASPVKVAVTTPLTIGRRNIEVQERPDPQILYSYRIDEEYYSGELEVNGAPLAFSAHEPVYYLAAVRYGADFSGLPQSFLRYTYAPSSGQINTISEGRDVGLPAGPDTPEAGIQAIADTILKLKQTPQA